MYAITPMNSADIPHVLAIWHEQFDRYCKNDSFPDFYRDGKETIEQYLMKQIDQNNAIVAAKDNTIIGYMAWMYVDFHTERTAFLPTVGSAAVAEGETAIFHALYTAASRKWVQDNRFNHLWMTFYDDIELRDMLYEIGFGSYVIDVCQRTYPYAVQPKTNYRITKAVEADADKLLALGNDSESNLYEAPIFLVRDLWTREEIIKVINEHQVFAAWDGDRMVGSFGVDINQRHHIEKLTCNDSAYSGGIGAYIIPEYRRKGIGKLLVQRAFDYCHQVGKPYMHVSFESANPDAIRFWPQYFKPAIRSVRRTVNKDAGSRY